MHQVSFFEGGHVGRPHARRACCLYLESYNDCHRCFFCVSFYQLFQVLRRAISFRALFFVSCTVLTLCVMLLLSCLCFFILSCFCSVSIFGSCTVRCLWCCCCRVLFDLVVLWSMSVGAVCQRARAQEEADRERLRRLESEGLPGFCCRHRAPRPVRTHSRSTEGQEIWTGENY